MWRGCGRRIALRDTSCTTDRLGGVLSRTRSFKPTQEVRQVIGEGANGLASHQAQQVCASFVSPTLDVGQLANGRTQISQQPSHALGRQGHDIRKKRAISYGEARHT